ncbi:uncharacterized protein IL334_005059 [Kwoniella shivajii]|uniref:Uncharacterized protein n=1 Tax=Kwoniella shivajii TaxID=564305 RepID=A0ABZ1D3I9_9TREE|nr:hypothetical protein IL334_005059 [Kwoniella shivajii]
MSDRPEQYQYLPPVHGDPYAHPGYSHTVMPSVPPGNVFPPPIHRPVDRSLGPGHHPFNANQSGMNMGPPGFHVGMDSPMNSFHSYAPSFVPGESPHHSYWSPSESQPQVPPDSAQQYYSPPPLLPPHSRSESDFGPLFPGNHRFFTERSSPSNGPLTGRCTSGGSAFGTMPSTHFTVSPSVTQTPEAKRADVERKLEEGYNGLQGMLGVKPENRTTFMTHSNSTRASNSANKSADSKFMKQSVPLTNASFDFSSYFKSN